MLQAAKPQAPNIPLQLLVPVSFEVKSIASFTPAAVAGVRVAATSHRNYGYTLDATGLAKCCRLW